MRDHTMTSFQEFVGYVVIVLGTSAVIWLVGVVFDWLIGR